MPIVRLPDGRQARFPDDMPREQIKAFIMEKFPQAKAQPKSASEDSISKAKEIGIKGGWLNDDGSVKGSWVNSDFVRKPAALMQGSLDATMNPVGQIAKGLNYSFGNGKWELPETLNSFKAETDTEKALMGAAKAANNVYGGLALGTGLANAGILGSGVSVPSKIAHAVFTSSNPAQVARQIAQGEAVNEYFDIQNPVARFAVGLAAANPASTLKAAKGVADLAGKGIKNTLGLTTGMGGKSVGQLYDAGKRGSKQALEHMRGRGNTDDIVEAAQTGLKNMKKSRSAAYAQTKEAIKQSGKKLDTQALKDVYSDVKSQYVDRGWKASSKEVDKVLEETQKVITDFEKHPKLHDAIGFDTLRQRLSQIKTEAGSAAEAAKRKIVNGIRDKITEIAPEYGQMMKDYSKASKAVDAMEEAFSLTKGGDTIFNKIKSALRDNVQTNFGRRAALAQQLEEAGATGLQDMVAGQAARAIMPRGLAQSGLAILGAKTANPAVALMSPRLVGEAAYNTGRLAGLVGKGLSKTGTTKALGRLLGEGFNRGTVSLPALGAILDGIQKGE